MGERSETVDPYHRPYDQEYDVLRNQPVIAQIITAWDLVVVIVVDELAKLVS